MYLAFLLSAFVSAPADKPVVQAKAVPLASARCLVGFPRLIGATPPGCARNPFPERIRER